MPESAQIKAALDTFAHHYGESLAPVAPAYLDILGIKTYVVTSPLLRDNNYPMIIHHGEKTKDVIVLPHGLSDSPYLWRPSGNFFKGRFQCRPAIAPRARPDKSG